MSKDGLLPKQFQKVHPKYHTPSFATIITGLVVGIPILFTDKTFVLDFTSIGTVFAFVLVCGGILLLAPKEKIQGRFHLPFISGKYLYPLFFLGGLLIFYFWIPDFFHTLLDCDTEFKISILIYIIINVMLCVLAFIKNLSLIPLLGLTSCLYLLTGMTHDNWIYFGIWFVIGLVIYFIYGIRNSNLADSNT